MSGKRIGFASSIGFGGSGVGTLYRPVSDQQADEVMRAAYDAGLRYFDTAPLYGYGLSELRLGRFLRSVPRDSFTLSTKVGRYLVPPRGEAVDQGVWANALPLKPVYDYSYDGTMRSYEQSASRLGFANFDILYIHDVDRFNHGAEYDRTFGQAMDGCYRALDELRSAGDIRAIGVGVNESDVATRFVRAGNFDAVMIAGRYTLLEQEALNDLVPEAMNLSRSVSSIRAFWRRARPMRRRPPTITGRSRRRLRRRRENSAKSATRMACRFRQPPCSFRCGSRRFRPWSSA
jgi:D-threo-aldose 1-dehydrogenase